MSRIRCPNCGKSIAANNFKTCPYCGRDLLPEDLKKAETERAFVMGSIPGLLVISVFSANLFGGAEQTIWEMLKAAAGLFLIFFFLTCSAFAVTKVAKENCKNPKLVVLWQALYVAALLAVILLLMSSKGCGVKL